MSTCNEKPPRSSPHGSKSKSTSGKLSSGSRKSPRTSTSDSPSASATNEHGRDVLDERLRSVLCHRLGLPLLYALHNKDPSTLMYLCKKRRLEEGGPELNGVYKEAVDEWKKGSIRQEKQLTKILVNEIIKKKLSFYVLNELKVEQEEKPDGHIDIIFSEAESKKPSNDSTPLTVIEFGLRGIDWWKKLDQGVKYVDTMRVETQQLTCVRFKKPLLLAVVTYDESCKENEKDCEFRIGVFLCSRKCTDSKRDECRMSLLWHTQSNTLEDASKLFGRLLHVTADFRLWRDDSDLSDDGFEYFSSNCCKVGNNNDGVVLRSYDGRVRKTNRSSEVYLSRECRDVVGDVQTVVDLRGEDAFVAAEFENCHINDKFWNESNERTLLIIAAPYRRGCHVAKNAKAFVPIIDQLEKLHQKGFVHGDIRAFNTVFGEQEDKGWLIDFDFGGKLGSTTCYPKGYRRDLSDGHRLGVGDNQILQWHDWHVLGQLIFRVHSIKLPPENSTMPELYDQTQFWTEDIDTKPSSQEVQKLKDFLCRLVCTVSPSRTFKIELEMTASLAATNGGATGSPPKKKDQGA